MDTYNQGFPEKVYTCAGSAITLIQFLEILSVWEIAHRWHGIDPDETDQGKVPRKVRETLRELLLVLNVYAHYTSGAMCVSA